MSKTFVATQDIFFGDPGRGVAAYRVGDKVTEEAVNTNDWHDFVEEVAVESPQPPRTGKGSGVEAWKQYADANTIAYADGASRDDIIAAVDAAATTKEN